MIFRRERCYFVRPKKQGVKKLILSPKKKVPIKTSPNILNLKGRLELSPKTLQKEEEEKEILKELNKTFYGESTPENSPKKSQEKSTPPISQD